MHEGHAFLKNSSGNPEVHLPLFEGSLSPFGNIYSIPENDRHCIIFELIFDLLHQIY